MLFRSSYLILSYLIFSYLILSYLILSCLILSCLISSCLVLSHLVLSYLILSYLILSYLTFNKTFFVLDSFSSQDVHAIAACVLSSVLDDIYATALLIGEISENSEINAVTENKINGNDIIFQNFFNSFYLWKQIFVSYGSLLFFLILLFFTLFY